MLCVLRLRGGRRDLIAYTDGMPGALIVPPRLARRYSARENPPGAAGRTADEIIGPANPGDGVWRGELGLGKHWLEELDGVAGGIRPSGLGSVSFGIACTAPGTLSRRRRSPW